jgi:hypothetical protein
MRRAAPGALLAALVVLLLVAIAPAVHAGAMAPRVTLKGPGQAGLNEQVTLSGTVVNTNGGEGAMYVVIQQKIDGAWRIIAKTKPRWTNSEVGAFAVPVKVRNPSMSLCRYRAVWEAGDVRGYSRTLVIAVE